MGNDRSNDSRHGNETQEERDFRESLGNDEKTKGFLKDLVDTSKAKREDDDRQVD